MGLSNSDMEMLCADVPQGKGGYSPHKVSNHNLSPLNIELCLLSLSLSLRPTKAITDNYSRFTRPADGISPCSGD